MKLEDGLLYVVVYGPGWGESVVVRAPPDTWVVFDGCEVGRRSLPAALLEEHGARWSGVVLSHPHDDHARGLVDVLERPGAGFVACADPSLDDAARWTASNDPETQLRAGSVEDLLAAIHDRWSADPTQVWRVRRGDMREIGALRVRALHPTDEVVHEAVALNRKSIALEVTWRGVRLLLGGDVEAQDWRTISESFPDLGKHAGLSVPHHGSSNATCAAWGDGRRQRLWIMSPYNRGAKLPRFEDGHGVEWALQRVDAVHLTGLPVRHELQESVPFAATRQAIRDGRAPLPVRATLPSGLVFHEQPPTDELVESCFVAVGFDDRGELRDLQHGPGAVVVREGPEETKAVVSI